MTLHINYPLNENYNRAQVIYNNKIFYFNSMKYDPRTYSYNMNQNNNFKNPSNKENYSFQNNNINSNYCFENNKQKINLLYILIEKQKTKKKKEKKVVVAGKGYVAAKELRKMKIN